MNNIAKPFYLLLFVLALLVNFIGINADFFSDDPGLYAAIAKNIVYKKDLLQLFTYNQDWLDKPHFPFWMIYLSFKLFGISVWAYRLPALLFFLLSALYTYLFSRQFYTKEIAVTAVLILVTAQHLLISNIDVRAEPYLMGLVIGSIYHIARFNNRFSYKHLLLAALLTACAIMTKGIFVIAAIYGGLLGQMVSQKKFTDIFSRKWYILFLLTFIFTLPEFFALYIQFDLHPEKTVFGRQGVSGIRWFLWDSQFGRFVNNGPIRQKKSGDVFFFMHTLLWAFAPWCLVFYFALFKNVQSIIHKIKLNEYYTFCGGLLMLLIFSVSRFQLPFYTNIIFPLFAIITAPYCCKLLNGLARQLFITGLLLFIILLPLVVILLQLFLRPPDNTLFIADVVVYAIIVFLIIIRIKAVNQKVFLLNCCSVLFVNFYLNTVLFKTLANYNGQIAAAKYADQSPFNQVHLYSLRTSNNVFQFYCKRPVGFVPIDEFNGFKVSGPSLFFVSAESVNELKQMHARFRVIKAFTDYPQENVLPAFISRQTRYHVLNNVYLITK